ncbi:MAG: phage terminase large subunit [Candidatus Berkelbacteria bacterium]|nr:phage terminase large subunit [Candidatus Berkelbacteria bacterium]
MTKENKVAIDQLIKNQAARVAVTTDSHLWFFHVYFNDYVKYEIAPFHREMFQISEDENVKLAVICSFRGSGKITLMTTSYPIWAILGKMKCKFVVIISQTQEQAKQHFANLKKELETNELLRQDLGPFRQMDEWNSCSLVIPKHNAKIIAVSREQSIRGVKHGSHRPDLIIADDIEDLASVKSEESRNNTYRWFTGEVLPLGTRDTKKILIGNMLHESSLVMRLTREIEEGARSGIFRKYPLLDQDGNIAWPGKYPDMEAIEAERKAVGDKFAWLREYLLIIADDQEPVIEKNWIHYYQDLPELRRDESCAYAGGVDLAVSEREKADYTAIVTCKIMGYGKDLKIYILPNPINSRMLLPVTIDNICSMVNSWKDVTNHRFYIEEVGTQRGLTQILKEKNVNAVGVSVGQNDKRTRLSMISEYIRSGKVVFPEKGCEQLLHQILDFGLTGHDDLCDALTTLISGIINDPPSTCNISYESMQKFRSDMYKVIYQRPGLRY